MPGAMVVVWSLGKQCPWIVDFKGFKELPGAVVNRWCNGIYR